jgi:hypothetical protein
MTSLPASSLRGPLLTAAAFTAVLSAASGRAHAGITMTLQRGAGTPSTLYIEGPHLRVDNAIKDERASAVILDAAGKRFVMLDERNKTYTELTEADMKRMRGQMEAARAQMQERLKTLPPAERKRMEAAMAGMGAPATGPAKPVELKFERLGAKKTVNGFACEMYRVLRDGAPHEEDCISPWSAGVVQKSDFAGLRKFAQEMSKNFGGAAAGSGQIDLDAMEKYPGIPISRIPLQPGGVKGEEEQIKSVKRGAIPDATFAVPAGFKKTELPHAAPPPGPPPSKKP